MTPRPQNSVIWSCGEVLTSKEPKLACMLKRFFLVMDKGATEGKYLFPSALTQKLEVSCGQPVPQCETSVMETMSRGSACVVMMRAAAARLVYERNMIAGLPLAKYKTEVASLYCIYTAFNLQVSVQLDTND